MFEVKTVANIEARLKIIEYTVPKTPELNGLAERMNRTIMERVRSMISHAKLPKSY